MLPITRANLQNFCRVCLRELPNGNTEGVKDPNHSINQDGFHKILHLIAGIRMKDNLSRLFPQTICHSCFIKTNALKIFRDKSLIAAGVLKMLMFENLQEATIGKLQLFCRLCLKRKSKLIEINEEIHDWIVVSTGLRLKVNENNDVDVLSDDERYPKQICCKCYASLKNCMEFRAITKQSHDYLNSLLDEFEEKSCDLKTQFEVVNNAISVEGSQEGVLNKTETLDVTIQTEIKDETEIEVEVIKHKDPILMHENTNFLAVLGNEDSSSNDSKISEISYSKIVRTMKTKAKEKASSFKCLECNKNFYKEHMFEAHKKNVHEGVEKPFDCEFCPSSFRLIQILNRHISDKHSTHTIDDKGQSLQNAHSHLCLYCQRPFKRKDHLKEHIRAVHEGLRPFKCSVCSKAFGSKNTQLRHEKNHSDERPFACEFCAKRYNSESELKVHIQRHTTNPELLCPICKRGKPNLEELQKHIAMHEASRQHQCQKCGKVFTKLFHLREHDSTVHLKLRPFNCSQCDQTFAVRKTLRTHERSHDPAGRPESCNVCKLNFKNKRSLSLHTKKIHSGRSD